MKLKINSISSKYIITMKKYLLTVIILLMLFSCSEDVLEEVPLSFMSPENSYLTEEGIRQGVSGINHEIRYAFYSMQRFTTMLTYRGMGADLAYFGEDPGTNRYLVDYVTFLTPTSAEVSDLWDTGYRIISRANLLIAKINETDESIFIIVVR